MALIIAAVSWFRDTLVQSPSAPEAPCDLIAKSISSSSAVYYPGDLLLDPVTISSTAYKNGIYHWAISSTQRSKCVVEPGAIADVAKTASIL